MPDLPPYVELHAHSAFSFHDGVSQPHELAAAAADLGYPGFALTDHDAVHGSMEFAHSAAPLGVMPIHGAELTLEGGEHITLIVEQREGWTTLCKLLTLAHADDARGLGAADPASRRASRLEDLITTQSRNPRA